MNEQGVPILYSRSLLRLHAGQAVLQLQSFNTSCGESSHQTPHKGKEEGKRERGVGVGRPVKVSSAFSKQYGASSPMGHNTRLESLENLNHNRISGRRFRFIAISSCCGELCFKPLIRWESASSPTRDTSKEAMSYSYILGVRQIIKRFSSK